MPDYIVLRLVPPAAIDANVFTTYLNGLTVNVYDISYAHPTDGTLIGSASFTPPAFPPPAGTHIVQHAPPPLFNLESVATAVILYSGGAPEFGGPDLRVEFVRAGKQIEVPQHYPDVKLHTIAGPFPSPAVIDGLVDSNVSAFVILPSPDDLVLLPADGTPPNFANLLAAVTAVLNADPGGPVTVAMLGNLNADRCLNIANEIIYSLALPLPAPPENLGDMFTDPPNTGGFGDSHEQNRQQFEGQLAGYYGPLDAKAARLAGYIYALAAAEWCELQTQAATAALVTFPVNPNAPQPPMTTMSQAQVIFGGALSLDVPAAYLYALTYDLPASVTRERRQQLVFGTDPQASLDRLKAAIAAGWIDVAATVNPAQAVRILQALDIPTASTAPVWNVTNPSAAQIFETDWLHFPSAATWTGYKVGDDQAFWQTEAGTPAFLDLVLYALTQGYMIGANSLAEEIKLHLLAALLTGVADVANSTPADWQHLFATLPGILSVKPEDVLPTFTLPGTVAARIAAFIAYVQKFFQLGTAAPTLNPVTATGPLRYGVPAYDVLAQTILNYAGFSLGMTLDPTTLEAAALAAAQGDEQVMAWAIQAVETLNELFILSQIPGEPAAFDFSLMEALFARGFTSREDVLDHPLDDFRQALTGTIAYDHAATIYANAGTAPAFPPPGSSPFGPINPGCLTDCIPLLELSPLGPVAYLSEMLRVSERSTCDRPFAPPSASHTALQTVIDGRRGPVETLAVTRANLETPLPLIDIVNECLEFMAASNPPTPHGAVYDTAENVLAGYKLCADRCDAGCDHHDCGCTPDDCECHEHHHQQPECHAPAVLLDALPEYSTPATPVPANASVVPAVWDKLKADFSICCLPYDQALDVNRTYLEHFRSCRFEAMRTFRKCITELVLDPVNQPADFQDHLWRYPVRLDIAIEYLGLSREEFAVVFQGTLPASCGGRVPTNPPGVAAPGVPANPPGIAGPRVPADPADAATQLPANPARETGEAILTLIPGLEACLRQGLRGGGAIRLSEFLRCTCLAYCDFIELWKSNFVPFTNGGHRTGEFPECEPCCLDDLWLRFPEEGGERDLITLIVFIRLWLKLRHLCGAGYSFAELADICTVLGFPGPDFIRQLAAFQMLRDQFRLNLTGRESPAVGATGADRTYLLALWLGPAAARWQWAVHELLHGIAYHARCRHECEPRAPEFIKLLEDNLDPLSRLCGFDPAVASDTWHAVPTHTLRLAEILSKIYASKFSIGEILFLFNADTHLDGDDPFPLQDGNEANDSPLGLPDDEHRHSLWELRRKLLRVHGSEEAAEQWSWRRIAASLTQEFGFPDAAVSEFGEHFFPDVLEAAGVPVGQAARRFTGALAATSAPMWNGAPEGPFRYDPAAQLLWGTLPLRDHAVLEQLSKVQALDAPEQQAVQDVYFGPRLMLSAFAMLFDDFDEAQHHLIQGRDGDERWNYFRRQFAKTHARCGILAEHLSEHLEAATGQERPEGSDVARLVLKNLFADENAAAAWQSDSGAVPPVTWVAPANGGAYAALLGLAGTGLDGEFTTGGGPVVWREIRDSLRPFGVVPDRENCPVPTVIPSMGLALTPDQMRYVTVRNGLAMDDARGDWLGGAQGFEAHWHGVLLVDRAGEYHFRAGAPTERDAEPSPHEAHHRSWRVFLKRGQKTWVLLRHRWHGEENLEPAAISLDRGAYDVTVEFVQHPPEYLREDEIHRQHTGFEIKYRGPDTEDHLKPIAPTQLFRTHKDGAISVPGLGGVPAAFLANRYDSSLRDIRRTYQRAFKALLFAHRFALAARPHAGAGSELGYMLAQADKFAGWSYYRSGGAFATHKADFDFNFLPIGDPYFSPAADDRAHPSHQRVEALFDWWERVFDYTRARREVRDHCGRHLWLLWAEAFDKQPTDPTSLLRHMGADARHWPLDLHYFVDQAAPVYPVTTIDLEDDRWTLRAWRADGWLRRLWKHFTVKDITAARPDLWASDNPAALVPGATETGNANLLRFLCDGCFDNGAPRRYDDVRRLSDGLRERGREALICYLCGPDGIAKSATELSDILLLDVLSGRCEKASRIEEAISAVQTFVRRARIGLEPGWTVTGAFAHLWDCRFISYRVWQACRRRELYKENWIDWHELEKAEKIEAFGLLNEQLKRVTLTIAEPGGVDFWPDQLPPSHPGLCLLQRRDPAEMQLLPQPREGLDLLATPERNARPSWITMVPEVQGATPPPSPTGVATNVPATVPPPPPPLAAATAKLPFWMECAIRLGTRFVRVAAAAYPPAATAFAPRHKCEPEMASGRGDKDKECCVTCCEECGCEHPARVDEYYFWLVDAERFEPGSQPVYTGVFDGQQNEYYDQNQQVAQHWHSESELPGLLEWPPEPMVRLAWCRVHNGEFKQPRRSVWGVAAAAAGVPDLEFAGRVGDSLYLELTNPGNAGFRYDMVLDAAHELVPFALPAAPASPPPPAGLPAYPYFVYEDPGARLFPWSLYSPSIAVAHALRAHCRMEAALKWYELVYNPLDRDNRWALCEPRESQPLPPPTRGGPNIPVNPVGTVGETGIGHIAGSPDAVIANPIGDGGTVAVVPTIDPGCCCDTTDIICRDARHRSLLLHYLDTLLEWGDALMRRNSPEAFQQARLVFDTTRHIMGAHPRVVKNPAHPSQTVATFKPLWASINPRLMTLYDQLDDRLSLIHDCESLWRLREGPRRCEGEYWDDDPVRGGWRTTLLHACCDTDGSCRPCMPYRFTFRIQKAKELASQTRELGNALLSAFEKGDAEFLASVRTRHEHELALLNRKVREDLWRDADWQVQALEKSKQSQQASRRYYANLIANGLNANENGYVDMTTVSMADRAAANISEGIAEAMDIVPDIFVGTVDFTQIPVGTKLAGLFKTIARITNTLADIAGSSAGLDLTEAGWDRRLQDWVHQVEVLDIQIEQTELQILGAERRRDQALREVNIQERAIENASEVLDLLRDKFTNHARYLYLQKHTADLHRTVFDLALNQAYEAERAFNVERGHTTHRFVGRRQWDNLNDGLLAGDRLLAELSHMEKAYFDHNCREYELAKHVSLRLSFPLEFLRLKLTGCCEIELPEWMFDLDYPGHYLRRIKSVSLTIPCVAGPYNEVHCRLTLLRSGTRIDPLPLVPAARCCDCCQSRNGYPVCPHDPRWVTQNGALEAIATSSGQADAGLFQVNFQDERYLPFEYHGAVSRWRIELPPENNYFDMESLSDVVMNLSYTAREGGEALRRAAREASACDLPGAGWCLFDLRHDFADAWELFRCERDGDERRHHGRPLDLRLSRAMFPFVPGDRELFIESLALLFERPEHCGCECPSECPCCSDPSAAHHELVLRRRDEDERRFECVVSDEWPTLYHGIVDGLCIGPLAGRRERAEATLWFPERLERIEAAYLLCRYTLKDKCCPPRIEHRDEHDHDRFRMRRHDHRRLAHQPHGYHTSYA